MPPTSHLSLIVDDDAAVRAFIRTVLQREHFKTLEADGGGRALEIVQSLRGRIDLIVTDVQMPHGDGLTLANAVKKSFPAVPIVLVSGQACPATDFDFLEKPFSWAALVKVVRRLVPPHAKTA